MKKLFTLALLSGALTVQAQQVNGSFNDEWTDCVPWIGLNNTKAQGTQPQGWKLSNVIGALLGTNYMGSTTIGKQVDGRDGSGYAVELTNTPNPYMRTKIVPGYLTLGTPWSTSVGSGLQTDGGTWGGIEFGYKPDAVKFWYKRAADTPDNPASFVGYLWSGEYTQENVPVNIVISGTPTQTTMTNRDVNILGKEYTKGGDVTEEGTLVASFEEYETEVVNDWTEKTIEFHYVDKNTTPEKLNLIFASSNYFSQDVAKGNSLTIDDVELVYYHALSALSYDGKSVDGFSSKNTSYTINGEYDASKLKYTKKGIGASVSTSFNEKSSQLTISVKGNDYDKNPESITNYVLTFTIPTAINHAALNAASTASKAYTLDGRRANAAAKGVLVKGGKKIIK